MIKCKSNRLGGMLESVYILWVSISYVYEAQILVVLISCHIPQQPAFVAFSCA